MPESLRNMKEYSGKTERNSPDRPPLPTELVWAPFLRKKKNEGIKFQRIDADVTDALKSKTSKKAEKEMEEQAESISKLYSMPGMDMSAFGGEGETLILNASHPLVQYITEHQDGENAEMICEQLYDLAKLQHAPLSADAMTKFVARSNDIMMLLTK